MGDVGEDFRAYRAWRREKKKSNAERSLAKLLHYHTQRQNVGLLSIDWFMVG